MEDLKILLVEEVQDELDDLGGLDVGSTEYKIGVDGIVKLTDKIIEIEKFEIEREDKANRNDLENRRFEEVEIKMKSREMDDENRDRFIKNCLTGATIVTGVALTVWGTVKSFEFEKEGTITTIMGRGFINKLLPKIL